MSNIQHPYYKIDSSSLAISAMNTQSHKLCIVVHKFVYRGKTNQIGYSDKPNWYEYDYSLIFDEVGNVTESKSCVHGEDKYFMGWADPRVSVLSDGELIMMIRTKFKLKANKNG